MREPDFDSLKERLLRGGVAPKHVRRMIAELRDHHTDLFVEAFGRGSSLEEAGREASIRLGDEDALAAAIIARPELRSWTHRWPWAAYCVTPAALFVVVSAGLLALLGFSQAVHADHDTFVKRWGLLASVIRPFYAFGLPLVLGAVCCVLAGQRREAPRWPVLGVMIVAMIGAAARLDVCWPSGPNAFGALCMTISIPPFPGSGSTLLRAAATCALTLAPYMWWRQREAR